MSSLDKNDHKMSNEKKHKRDKKRKRNLDVRDAQDESASAVIELVKEVTEREYQPQLNNNIDANEDSNRFFNVQSNKKSKHDQNAPFKVNNTSNTNIKTAQPGSKPASLWNFTVDYNDHFETPPIAYKDLSPVLEALCGCVNKTSAELTIYDPYWCEGSVVSHLHNLGYDNVINRNRDFYLDIKKKNIPDYDVLVTNPPYSGEHKVNLLKFLATHTAKASVKKGSAGGNSSSTDCEAVVNDSSSSNDNNAKNSKSTTTPNTSTTLPFALLLPVYTATKSYWKDFAQAQALVGKNAFYILPPDFYEYSHPEGTGKDIPPFYSAWFLGGFTNEQKNRILASLRNKPRPATPSTVKYAIPLKRLSFGTLTVAESVEALVSRGVVTDSKRPNPKQRQKMKLKK